MYPLRERAPAGVLFLQHPDALLRTGDPQKAQLSCLDKGGTYRGHEQEPISMYLIPSNLLFSSSDHFSSDPLSHPTRGPGVVRTDYSRQSHSKTTRQSHFYFESPPNTGRFDSLPPNSIPATSARSALCTPDPRTFPSICFTL
jgi:hypothetical protein